MIDQMSLPKLRQHQMGKVTTGYWLELWVLVTLSSYILLFWFMATNLDKTGIPDGLKAVIIVILTSVVLIGSAFGPCLMVARQWTMSKRWSYVQSFLPRPD